MSSWKNWKGDNPHFFDEFQMAIESGDHLLVQRAIAEAGRLTLVAISAWPESQDAFQTLRENRDYLTETLKEINGELEPHSRLSPQALEDVIDSILNGSLEDAYACSLAIVCFLYVFVAKDVAITLNILIFINFAIWFAVYVWIHTWAPDMRREASTPLTQEQIIDSIVELLGPTEPMIQEF